MNGGKRSLNPTHSVVAFGKRAAWFVAGHEHCETPCGTGSPFDKLAETGGKILLLGCDHQSNTSIHMIEELAKLDYHMIPGSAQVTIVDMDGRILTVTARFHSWETPRNFNVVDELLSQSGAQVKSSVGLAEARLVDARAMRMELLPILHENPRYLCAA
jgi:aminoglycoside 3-N-acetyltransferase